MWGLGAGAGTGSAGDPGAVARCRAGGPDQHQCPTIRVRVTYLRSPEEVQHCGARHVTITINKKPRIFAFSFRPFSFAPHFKQYTRPAILNLKPALREKPKPALREAPASFHLKPALREARASASFGLELALRDAPAFFDMGPALRGAPASFDLKPKPALPLLPRGNPSDSMPRQPRARPHYKSSDFLKRTRSPMINYDNRTRLPPY